MRALHPIGQPSDDEASSHPCIAVRTASLPPWSPDISTVTCNERSINFKMFQRCCHYADALQMTAICFQAEDVLKCACKQTPPSPFPTHRQPSRFLVPSGNFLTCPQGGHRLLTCCSACCLRIRLCSIRFIIDINVFISYLYTICYTYYVYIYIYVLYYII